MQAVVKASVMPCGTQTIEYTIVTYNVVAHTAIKQVIICTAFERAVGTITTHCHIERKTVQSETIGAPSLRRAPMNPDALREPHICESTYAYVSDNEGHAKDSHAPRALSHHSFATQNTCTV